MNSGALLFSFDYPPASGGISRLCAGIVHGLRREGHSAGVLTQGRGTADCGEGEIRIAPRRPAREWLAFRKLSADFRRGLTICGLWYPEGLIAWLAGVRSSVVLAHGAEILPPAQGWRRPIWKVLQRRVLENAAAVVANSEFTGRMVLESAPRARVHVLPLGVDHTQFVPGCAETAKKKFGVEGKIVVSSVSRLFRYKGHDTVLRAIAALAPAERERLSYLVAGSGPAEEQLKTLASDLGISSCVRWLGFVPEPDLPALYQASDLFALCTRHSERAVEGFGLVFLEAQSCGIPVVGTRTGGIPEAIREGEGGWLIEPEDAAALAEIIRSVIASPEQARHAGESGRARILCECTWDLYIRKFASILEHAGEARD